MLKLAFYIFTLTLAYLLIPVRVHAQKQDTFFLAKKKGLLGRFGRSISHNVSPDLPPEKIENRFMPFKGKIIRTIFLEQLNFGCSVYDTCDVTSSFGTNIANKLHKNTRAIVISRNLFFKEGDKLSPYLFADNERYLRELVYIQDARIIVDYAEGSADSVDVLVLTKDIFTIGGKLVIEDRTKGRAEIKDEDFAGSGSRLMFSGFYDNSRKPVNGFGAELTRRNIRGSFIDFSSGFQNYGKGFNSGRNEEISFYTRLEKPLVTPYKPSTGAVEWSYSRTSNAYISDSLYQIDYKYAFYNIDGWIGYSLDSKRRLYADKEIKVHRFIAGRGFTQRFLSVPNKYRNIYDYHFADFTGALVSLNIFKQAFYRNTFVYGFGRTEDIPEGFSIAATAGYINKESIKRPYAGLDVQLTNVLHRGNYNNYTFRAGGYFYRSRFEDVDLLFNLEHFSRLKKLGHNWYQRSFINTGVTAQVNPALNAPLFLNSIYGLTYINNETISADLRLTAKFETVFYNMKKIVGFRLAPFAFADICVVKPTKMGLEKSELYSGIGGGIRTRNENLVFGTIELKGYYFPRTNGDMRNWKVELNSNIRFKYISSFIRRPDFIIAN